MENKIKDYYNSYDEDGRLRRDNAHRVEFLTTIHYLDRLMPPNSRILDACAGTGAYAFYLADKGHSVTAGDLVPHNVDVMRSSPNAGGLADIRVCNAMDLALYDMDSFDAVLCMGALYHLSGEDRTRAVLECKRVLRPGGLLVLAYLNDPNRLFPIPNPAYDIFLSATTEEMAGLAADCGLETVCRLSADGTAFDIAAELNAASPEAFEKWMAYHLSVCESAYILDNGRHGLDICRKP